MIFIELFILYIHFFLVNINQCVAVDWCTAGKPFCIARYSMDPAQHIFCLYPTPGPGNPGSEKNCKNAKPGTHDKFRQEMFDWHNDFRNKWANKDWPGQAALGFHKTYDTQLEKMAQQFVDNCHPTHENCKATERSLFGQNIAWSYSGSEKRVKNYYKNLFNNWINEFKDFKPEHETKYDDTPYEGKKISHFVAAIWAETHRIGCAFANYETLISEYKETPYGIAVVCNYAPAGGYFGRSVVVPGEPGKNCPKDTVRGYAKKYPHLCGSGESSPADKPFDSKAITIEKAAVGADGKPVIPASSQTNAKDGEMSLIAFLIFLLV